MMLIVRCGHTVEAGQVNAGLGYQGCQACDKAQLLEDYMRSAITVRGLELVTNIPTWCQRQPLFRNRRPGNVATQPLQLLALVGPRRHPGMQRESSYLAHRVIEWLIAGRQGGLQCKHPAA